MRVKAFAKINIGLRILRRRSDGFHDIETIFHRINLFDELEIKSTRGKIVVTSSVPALPTDSQNLCWKAVRLLQDRAGTSRGASVHIQKLIPTGGGLGGGSSDSASTLKSLVSLWDLDLNDDALKSIALKLGSDVPFFLGSHSAFAEGRGERLSFIPLSVPYWIVVVFPNFHISTKWAYREFSKHDNVQRENPMMKHLTRNPESVIRNLPTLLVNDFEPILLEAFPAIGEIKTQLLKAGAAFALMSGSGSSVFGMFEGEQRARNAAEDFQRRFFVSITEPNFSLP